MCEAGVSVFSSQDSSWCRAAPPRTMDMSTVDPQGPQAHVPHRWYETPRMSAGMDGSGGNIMAPEEMEVFFPSSLDSNSNRARSYYQAAAQMHSPYGSAATHGRTHVNF